MSGPDSGRDPEALRPPWRSRALLVRMLPPADRADLLPALDEVFARRAARTLRWRARWWYRRQVAELAVYLMIGAVRSRLGDEATIATSTVLSKRHVERKVGMGSLIQDARFAFRRLLKTPLVTFAVVVSLALAIGANSSIFGAINTLLLRPFPFEEPERLVRLYGQSRSAVGSACRSLIRTSST